MTSAVTTSLPPPRVLIGIRLIVGAGLLAAPSALLAKLLHEPLDPPALAFTRILGARHLAQAVWMTRHHTRDWILAGAAVDGARIAELLALVGMAEFAHARPRQLSGGEQRAAVNSERDEGSRRPGETTRMMAA